MRFKEGEIPSELLSKNASDDMLSFTAVIAVVIGLVLFFLGRMGRQMWMWCWGLALIFSSVYLWLYLKFEFAPFGYFLRGQT